MAMWGVGTMVGPILGPSLGGWLTDEFTWRWVFYVNLPVGVMCAVGVLLLVRDSNSDRSGLVGLHYDSHNKLIVACDARDALLVVVDDSSSCVKETAVLRRLTHLPGGVCASAFSHNASLIATIADKTGPSRSGTLKRCRSTRCANPKTRTKRKRCKPRRKTERASRFRPRRRSTWRRRSICSSSGTRCPC